MGKADDRREQTRMEKKLEKVKQALGYIPQSYFEQEEAKRQAYPIMRNRKEPFSKRMQAALSLIKAHFDRSLESAIEMNYWRNHPTFEQYVAMMDYTGIIPSDIWEEICRQYGQNKGHIPPGFTMWYPPKSRHREQQFIVALRSLKRSHNIEPKKE